MQYERRLRAQHAPIEPSTVVYESYAGNGMVCNPEAIFRAALAAADLQHLRHVWALDDPNRHAASVAEFAGDPRVRFVVRGSSAYYRALATAKYLVNNATFPDPWGKREGQVYLNTWHGTPVKAMGFDVPGGALVTRNVVRNFVAADYLLAPNADTENMYLSAYRMSNIFRGRLLTTGTPRIDAQFGDDAARKRVHDRLARAGLHVDSDESLVLYAPTWRGDFYSPTDDLVQLRAFVETVSNRLPSGSRLLLKVHQQVYAAAAKDARLAPVLVPNDVPTNELLAITDLLITDYSSIFVDYLATGRPIVFYAPDLDEYAHSRGWYLPPDEWPGPVCRSTEELIDALNAPGPAHPRYADARARYCPRESGDAAERVVDVLFRDQGRPNEVRSEFADGRTSLLINLGGMLANGITMSGLSLLDTIDHDRFDVSAMFPHPSSPERLRLVELINPRVRLFPQPASLNGSKLRVRMLAAASGRRRQRLRNGYRELMRQEWQRAFGASRFDHVVEFSGYEPYWIKLLESRPSGTLSIWLHNDIAAEMTNPSRTSRLRARIRAVVTLYAGADRLVSVSAALDEVNRAKLASWAPADRFTHARNTINAGRIEKLAAEPADDFAAATGTATFVTAGRLSAEKNHARLIRAFAKVHDTRRHLRLVILGDGPERARLQELTTELGLTEAVLLAGHRRNPYAVMAQCDCFVLSSDYEGQPIALLEALILRLPVVTTAFGSVRDALPEGAGSVVDANDDALAEGMRAFLRGEVRAAPFDAADYNAQAIAEFYGAIGSAADSAGNGAA